MIIYTYFHCSNTYNNKFINTPIVTISIIIHWLFKCITLSDKKKSLIFTTFQTLILLISVLIPYTYIPNVLYISLLFVNVILQQTYSYHYSLI